MQARSAERAARASADAQIAAARIAAEEARFRPVGITTRFGQSQFTTGPDGRVRAASYTVSPELRAYQDRLMGMAGGQGMDYLAQAPELYAPMTDASQRLFNLGQRYLAESPEQVAQRYMTSQLDILAPQRERQLAALRNEQFQAGRSGLSVGATGMRWRSAPRCLAPVLICWAATSAVWSAHSRRSKATSAQQAISNRLANSH